MAWLYRRPLWKPPFLDASLLRRFSLPPPSFPGSPRFAHARASNRRCMHACCTLSTTTPALRSTRDPFDSFPYQQSGHTLVSSRHTCTKHRKGTLSVPTRVRTSPAGASAAQAAITLSITLLPFATPHLLSATSPRTFLDLLPSILTQTSYPKRCMAWSSSGCAQHCSLLQARLSEFLESGTGTCGR